MNYNLNITQNKVIYDNKSTIILDNIDMDLANLKYWSKNNSGYFYVNSHSLHVLILERKLNRKIQSGYICDHINRNKLDNRRENLREMPKCAANWNINKPNNNRIPSSKYKGVSFNKEKQKYQSKIKFQNKTIHLGWFKDEIKAARIYNTKSIELFGEFASINEGV